MSTIENKQGKIYYRPLHKWIDVTLEQKQNWERFTGATRKARQRAGACCIPFKKSFQCDGWCDDCQYRCIPKDTPQTLSIDLELETAQDNGVSPSSLLCDDTLTTEISIDSVILSSLLDELKHTDEESYRILMFIAEGLSERECAKLLGIPKNTYVYRRDKLLKALRQKF